jgi:hypothetical protein
MASINTKAVKAATLPIVDEVKILSGKNRSSRVTAIGLGGKLSVGVETIEDWCANKENALRLITFDLRIAERDCRNIFILDASFSLFSLFFFLFWGGGGIDFSSPTHCPTQPKPKPKPKPSARISSQLIYLSVFVSGLLLLQLLLLPLLLVYIYIYSYTISGVSGATFLHKMLK